MSTKLTGLRKLTFAYVDMRWSYIVNKCGRDSGVLQDSYAQLSGVVLSMTKEEINKTLQDFDEAIDKAEANVARLQELRREFINQYNLNKETSDDLCTH